MARTFPIVVDRTFPIVEGRPFGHEGKLEVADDPIDNFIIVPFFSPPLWLIELKAVHVPSKM